VINPANLGKAIGELANVIIYNKSHNNALTFLAEPEMHIPEEFKKILNLNREAIADIVDGFFEGVSAVPYNENKCKNDIAPFKDMIVDGVYQTLHFLRSGQPTPDAYKTLNELAIKLKPLEANCHFDSLSKTLINMSNEGPALKAKITEKIYANMKDVLESLNEMTISLKSGDNRTAGKGLGKFLKIVLGYSTN
jgi:hypothetical protein